MGMNPYLFDIFPTYTLCMFGGALICLFLLYFLKTNEKGHISRTKKMLGGASALIFGFIGAKALHIILNLSDIVNKGTGFSDIMLYGFVFYGGLIGGVIGLDLFCFIFKINVIDFFDVGAIFLALGTAIGRLGCYCVGCCYGAETGSFLGVQHIDLPGVSNDSLILPTQLFEFGYCMLIFAVLIVLSRKERPRGLLFCVYAIGYSVCRFVNEFFRADMARGFIGALSTSQFISIFVFAAALLYVALAYLKKRGLIFSGSKK